MMLEPPMNELLDQVPSRYMLVNVVAQRARQIASASEDSGIPLTEKPVTLAIHEVAAGEVELENRAEEPDDGIL
ncbi:MAG: DNA-directed RNA polymerase subunit omega [Flavonifractor sp.]|jgi:DNA-directed RNA polymerase subunit omega|nr:DNA-directed RNA polymerase subunit omega [Flavonifractor sp.]MCI9424549.1 DNA-directed RNA polymerase subunit omega [Flavonifractor sp.]MCI9473024.1 DNA-directed RNA polymerase subunit omega [Flavonifractor sp.]